MRSTDEYEGLLAETITLVGFGGQRINAYYARPLGTGPFPGITLFHHRPGWDEWYKETTRRYAHHGYAAICPDLYSRFPPGPPDEVAARVRAEGDVSDEQVVADGLACVGFLRAQLISTGKVAVMGSCSGGRHAYLAACQGDVDAVIDCWGGRVVMEPGELNEKYPVAPIDLTRDLSCPILGLFGEDDKSPSPAMVARHEAELKEHGKATSSTATRALGMDSFTTTSRQTTVRSRRWTAGRKFGISWTATCPSPGPPPAHEGEVVCTTIGFTSSIAGSGKGIQGWFRFDRVWLSYDHPFHEPAEHAVSIDFVDGTARGQRVAVEMSRAGPRASRAAADGGGSGGRLRCRASAPGCRHRP